MNDESDNDELVLKRAEKNLIVSTARVLDSSLETIDNQTLTRLKQMRQQAAAEAASNELAHEATHKTNRSQWISVAGIAAVLTVVLLIENQVIDLSSQGTATQEAVVKNIDSEATIELAQSLISEQSQPWQFEEDLLDDMDFYAWLELREQMGNVNAG